MDKGQGALEYLILIAVVLVVAAATTMFLAGAFSGQKMSAAMASCQQAASSCSISLLVNPGASCPQCETQCIDPTTGLDVISGTPGCGTACQACKRGDTSLSGQVPDTGGGGDGGGGGTTPPANSPPVAVLNPYPASCAKGGDCGVFYGTNSYDTDGSIASYAWTWTLNCEAEEEEGEEQEQQEQGTNVYDSDKDGLDYDPGANNGAGGWSGPGGVVPWCNTNQVYAAGTFCVCHTVPPFIIPDNKWLIPAATVTHFICCNQGDAARGFPSNVNTYTCQTPGVDFSSFSASISDGRLGFQTTQTANPYGSATGSTMTIPGAKMACTGTLYVTLTVTDDDGATGTASVTVPVSTTGGGGATTGGTVSGTITDSGTGIGVPGTTVKLTDKDGTLLGTTTTANSGAYSITAADGGAGGPYTITPTRQYYTPPMPLPTTASLSTNPTVNVWMVHFCATGAGIIPLTSLTVTASSSSSIGGINVAVSGVTVSVETSSSSVGQPCVTDATGKCSPTGMGTGALRIKGTKTDSKGITTYSASTNAVVCGTTTVTLQPPAITPGGSITPGGFTP